MRAKTFLAILFGILVPALPVEAKSTAAKIAEGKAAPVRIEVRGKLSVIGPAIDHDPRADRIQACLPPLREYVLEARGQRFNLNANRFFAEIVNHVGKVVLLTGTLDLDTINVTGVEIPSDKAPGEFVRVTVEGELEREEIGTSTVRSLAEVVWRVRAGHVGFTLTEVPAEALLLVGQRVTVTGRLEGGKVHVAGMTQVQSLKDLGKAIHQWR